MWTLVPDGQGSLVKIRPEKARASFSVFRRVNLMSPYLLHLFAEPLLKQGVRSKKFYDRLFRHQERDIFSGAENNGRLGKEEIAFLEKRISEFVIFGQYALLEEERRLTKHTVPFRGVGCTTRKAQMLQRYGLIFEVSPLSLEELLGAERGDILVRDKFYDLELLRYEGLFLDPKKQRMCGMFRHRLALFHEIKLPVQELLQKKQFQHFFEILRVTPVTGVHLACSLPILPLR